MRIGQRRTDGAGGRSLLEEIVRDGAARCWPPALKAERSAYIAPCRDTCTVVDGIHLKVSLAREKLCLMVMLGVRRRCRKELARDHRRIPGVDPESWDDGLRSLPPPGRN